MYFEVILSANISAAVTSSSAASETTSMFQPISSLSETRDFPLIDAASLFSSVKLFSLDQEFQDPRALSKQSHL